MIGQTVYESNAREMKLYLERKRHNWRLRDKTIRKNREDNDAIRRRIHEERERKEAVKADDG